MDKQRIFVPNQHTKQADLLLVTFSLQHDLGINPELNQNFDLAESIANHYKRS